MTEPKILTVDIETSPNLAHVWGLYDQTVSLSQLREASSVMCFAAKWHHIKGPIFLSDFHDGHDKMVVAAYNILSAADIVVHYNGTSFDLPHLRREFLLAGLPPLRPLQEVDLLRVVRKHFKFASNKLDHVAQQLGLGRKVAHSGHDLWVRCMAGEADAWAKMKRYNINDVRLTEDLYDRIRPWISNHPSVGLWTDQEWACNRCGGTDLERRGYAYTAVGRFIQLRCKDCGAWSRKTARDSAVKIRGVA